MYNKPINAVHVEVTDRCNSECPGCARAAFGGPVKDFIKNNELGLEYFTDYIGVDFCKQIKAWNFCGNLGDPSNAHDLVEIVNFLFTCNPDTRIEIRTNGGARNEKFWFTLGEAFKGKVFEKQGGVIWSIDGLSETNHLHRKNVKWDKLWKNFQSYFLGLNSNLNSTDGEWIETPVNDGREITKFYFNSYNWSNGAWEFLLFDHNKKDIENIKDHCKSYNLELRIKQPYGFQYDIDTGSTVTMPVYDRQPNKDGNYNLLYTLKPYGSNNLIDDHVPFMQENAKFTYPDPDMYNEVNIQKYISKNNYNIDIDCFSISEEWDFYEIFLNADGSIFPCCFHANKIQTGEKQINEMYGNYNNVLSKDNKIEDILNSNLFKKDLPAGMNGDLNGKYCYTCMDSCSNNQNIAKKLLVLGQSSVRSED